MGIRKFIFAIFFAQLSLSVAAQVVDTTQITYTSGYIAQDTLTLDEVVVTSTRSRMTIKDVPIQTQVITSREIKSSGMNKLEDVLSSQLPGMEFHQAGYGTSMTFQGLDARNILILVDGERLSGDTNGNIDFSKIPTESIDRIEVVKGSLSVLYGSSATGATINIITKTPKNGLEGSAYYSFGGYNQLNKGEAPSQMTVDIPNMTAAAYLGYNTKRFVTATDITYQSIDPYRLVSKRSERRDYTIIDGQPNNMTIYVPIDSNGISVSGWQSLAVNQKLLYDISNSLDARFKAGYTWKNRYDLGDYSQSAGDLSSGVVPFENYQGYNIDAGLLYTINSSNNIDFSYHTSTTSRKQDSLSVVTPKQRGNISTARVLYRNSSFKNNSLIVGMEFNRETLKLDLSSGGFADDYDYNNLSVYAQDDYKFCDKFSTVVGLRLDNYGFYDAKSFFSNFSDASQGDGAGLSLTPQFAAKYTIGRTSIRFNYAMGFRSPSLKERYMEYYQPYMGMTIKGNPDLKPERNNYLSLSSDYYSATGKLYLSGNVYANLFKDKIDSYLDADDNSYVYQNTSSSQLYGVDLSARVVVLNGWWLNGNYSFSHRAESGPVNSAQYIFASPHTASIQTNYLMNLMKWDLNFNMSASYYSSKSFEDMMPTIIQNSGSLIPEVIQGVYTGYLEGYALCNFSFSAILNKQWTFTAGVNNFLNYQPSVASFNSAVTPGITGFISARVEF